MKTENWNGHEIRFVALNGEWWAVAKDVSDALGYQLTTNMTKHIDEKDKGISKVHTLGGSQEMLIISEFGIYDAVFNSRKPEAADFKRWIFEVIKALRQAAGLEGFEIFRMLDKEHQRQAMERLKDGIKANTIANKAIFSRSQNDFPSWRYPKHPQHSERSVP